jgi:hypothetical protein
MGQEKNARLTSLTKKKFIEHIKPIKGMTLQTNKLQTEKTHEFLMQIHGLFFISKSKLSLNIQTPLLVI